MVNPIEQYLAEIRATPWACEEIWLTQQLVAARGGHQGARAEIATRCQPLVLALIESHPQPDDSLILELLAEGNTTVLQVLDHFTGSSAEQFWQQLMLVLDLRLAVRRDELRKHRRLYSLLCPTD